MNQSLLAVAPAVQPDSPVFVVESVAGRADIERIEATIRLPSAFQYLIPGRKKVGNDWADDNKVGITSDGYAYLNRWVGVSFFLPDWVPDEHGELARNPIHRPDYIYMRMLAVWYNEAGQMVSTTEDLEVDYWHLYASARVESFEAVPIKDPNTGMPVFDQRGNPVYQLKDDKAEVKAAKALMQLRTMGMRYAQTVLRTRLLKVAMGIKSLPLQQPAPFNVRVVGYRDKMNPQERESAVASAMAAMFGMRKAQPVKPLTHTEMADIQDDGADAMTEVLSATGLLPDDQSGEFDLPQ